MRVRWLLLKDLRILRRSPLLVALLVLYPIVIARADRLRAVARAGQAEGRLLQRPAGVGRARSSSAGETDRPRRRGRAAVRRDRRRCSVKSREEAIQKVQRRRRAGRARDPARTSTAATSQSTLEPGTRRGLLQRRGPGQAGVRREHDQGAGAGARTPRSRKRLTQEALKLLDLISTGGDYHVPRPGLQRARAASARSRSCARRRAELPPGHRSARPRPGARASRSLARDNLVVLGRRAERRGRADPGRRRRVARRAAATSLDVVRGRARGDASR